MINICLFGRVESVTGVVCFLFSLYLSVFSLTQLAHEKGDRVGVSLYDGEDTGELFSFSLSLEVNFVKRPSHCGTLSVMSFSNAQRVAVPAVGYIVSTELN